MIYFLFPFHFSMQQKPCLAFQYILKGLYDFKENDDKFVLMSKLTCCFALFHFLLIDAVIGGNRTDCFGMLFRDRSR